MPREGSPKEVHNMVVLGTGSPVYLSHMAKFKAPHDYQCIVQAVISGTEYETGRHRFGTSALFTLSPDPLSIADLQAPTSVSSDTLHGRLFFGHAGRDGDVLGDTAVDLKQTLYFQRLNLPASRSPELRYIFFGGRAGEFLAHQITGPPDFDQILAVQPMAGNTQPLDSPPGTLLGFPGRENLLDGRLAPGEQVKGTVMEGDGSATQYETHLQVVAEVYLETDDLQG
ncbi:hypothetical protein ABZ946_04205 [Streptomyces sp. NPDC046324]|uniref:hypothetical protein n=1 Tax=Streptomyces sp. NPDC046324 TaxID=3154915 RepID=UPI0034116E06